MFSKPCIRCGDIVKNKYKSKLDRIKFCRECGVREGARQKDKKVTANCVICNKEFRVKLSKFNKKNGEYVHCSMKCAQITRVKKVSGSLHPRWKEIKAIPGAYVYKRICVGGKYYYEHRYVMEKYIGRSLDTNEHVHHINHDRTDNRIENLQILTNSEHGKLHLEERGGKI